VGTGQGYTCGVSPDQVTLSCWGRRGSHLGFPNTSVVSRPALISVF
jgi:hypothetical protein